MQKRIWLAATIWLLSVLGFTHLIGIGHEGNNVFVQRTFLWISLFAISIVCFSLFLNFTTNTKSNKRISLVLILLTMLIQLTSPIGISTDFYRYIWQGRASNQDYSRYEIIPNDFAPDHPLNEDLYDRMDWTEVRSIYPPLTEDYFRTSAVLYDSPGVQSLPDAARLSIAKLPMLTAFLVAGYLIYLLSSKSMAALLWLGSPVTQFEFLNSAHIEVVSLTFILLSILLIHKKTNKLSVFLAGCCLSAAVLVKVTPLLYVAPLLAWLALSSGSNVSNQLKINWHKVSYFTIGFSTPLLAYLPTILANDAIWPKQLLEWSSGSAFTLGNPVYEILSRLFSEDSASSILRLTGLVIYSYILIKLIMYIQKASIPKKLDWLSFYALAGTALFVSSAIILPWYWLPPIVLLALSQSHIISKPQYTQEWLKYLTAASLLLAIQYVDRADYFNPNIKLIVTSGANAVLICLFYYVFIRYRTA